MLEQIAMGFICPECRVKFNTPEQLGAHYANIHEQSDPQATSSGPAPGPRRAPDISRRSSQTTQLVSQQSEDVHEEFLRALEPQLAELKEVSLALSNALDAQNSQLERIDQRVDIVTDGMKRVSMQAKKLTGSRLAVNYRFRCAFQEVGSGKFLRDLDGEASLRYAQCERHCHWGYMEMLRFCLYNSVVVVPTLSSTTAHSERTRLATAQSSGAFRVRNRVFSLA